MLVGERRPRGARVARRPGDRPHVRLRGIARLARGIAEHVPAPAGRRRRRPDRSRRRDSQPRTSPPARTATRPGRPPAARPRLVAALLTRAMIAAVRHRRRRAAGRRRGRGAPRRGSELPERRRAARRRCPASSRPQAPARPSSRSLDRRPPLGSRATAGRPGGKPAAGCRRASRSRSPRTIPTGCSTPRATGSTSRATAACSGARSRFELPDISRSPGSNSASLASLRSLHGGNQFPPWSSRVAPLASRGKPVSPVGPLLICYRCGGSLLRGTSSAPRRLSRADRLDECADVAVGAESMHTQMRVARGEFAAVREGSLERRPEEVPRRVAPARLDVAVPELDLVAVAGARTSAGAGAT